jgi:hypothetical protein
MALLVLAGALNSVLAQDISNVRAFQEDGKAVIVYDLLSVDPAKEFYVKIFSSSDGGKTYNTLLTKATGDVNTMVKAGPNRMAVWDVMKETSLAKGDFVFRVDALSIGPNGVLPAWEDRGIAVQFLDVTKTGSDVAVVFSLNNKSSAATQFILANFTVVDDQQRFCSEITGDVGQLISIPLKTSKIMTFIVKNVSPNAKAFTQLKFNATAITVDLKNLPIIPAN